MVNLNLDAICKRAKELGFDATLKKPGGDNFVHVLKDGASCEFYESGDIESNWDWRLGGFEYEYFQLIAAGLIQLDELQKLKIKRWAKPSPIEVLKKELGELGYEHGCVGDPISVGADIVHIYTGDSLLYPYNLLPSNVMYAIAKCREAQEEEEIGSR